MREEARSRRRGGLIRRTIAGASLLAGVWAASIAAPAAATPPEKEKQSSAVLKVRVELLPGQTEKVVDPSLPEMIPVAILGGPEFDVRSLDPASISLGGAAVAKYDDGSLATYRDVNHDRKEDMVVQILSSRLRIPRDSSRALLIGKTLRGGWIEGSASVETAQHVRAEHGRSARTSPLVEKLPPIPVAIDILPGNPSKRIDLGNRGTVEVAVLSAPDFDATSLDPSFLTLAGSPVTRRKGHGMGEFKDVNGDGLNDLIVEAPKQLLHLKVGDTEAELRGMTPAGRQVRGVGRIQIGDKATMVFDSESLQPSSSSGSQPTPDFYQEAGITINDNAPATPYPSSITVSGVPGVISKVTVTLKGLTHSYPDDIDILLVGPTGQSLILMSDVGGQGPGVSNIDMTFDDDAYYQLTPVNTPGTYTYQPINFGSGDVFPGPAPAPSPATGLSAFNGTNPNGVWSLYVLDDLAGDSGSISRGWSIDFTTAIEVCNSTPIAIFDNAAAAPYPSPINVAGLPEAISKVSVKLNGLSHTYPDDIDMLLEGPAGQTAMVMSDAGGIGPGVASETLVLDDNAALALDPSANPVNGTYQPLDLLPGDTMLGLAPAGPYQSPLYQFDGTNPNGFWHLWIVDDASGDSGSMSGGWCLDITTRTPDVTGNSTYLTIPAGAPSTTSGTASLYPSPITVSGIDEAVVSKITVTLNGLSHTYPQDLDILLVGPTGVQVMLMSDVGGVGPGMSNATLTFDDAGPPIPVSSNIPSGTYHPSNDDSGGADTFPFPAPPLNIWNFLSIFYNEHMNGTWNLYVVDDAAGDVGSLSGGWTLTIQTYLNSSDNVSPFSRCDFSGFTIPYGSPGTTLGPATPYPSNITTGTYPGYPGSLSELKTRVTLYGLTHSFPQDLDIALVGPEGLSVMLMSDAGGIGPGVNNVNLTFDDDAAAPVAQGTNPMSGVYRPTNYDDGFADSFAASCPPACSIFPNPTAPFGSSLSVLKGTNPYNWELFIMDDGTGDVGSLQGWCIEFLPSLTAGEVTNLRWTSSTQLEWDAAPNATSYDLFRGDPSQLASLKDPTVDSCPRGSTLTQAFAGLTETPALGAFHWYLVRGHNAQGEGAPGFSWNGSLSLARLQEGSGVACP
jgi:subtilisin-like proprotein convertase family protein